MFATTAEPKEVRLFEVVAQNHREHPGRFVRRKRTLSRKRGSVDPVFETSHALVDPSERGEQGILIAFDQVTNPGGFLQ